jgi:glycerol-3-phosphate dehydrogenase
MNRSDAIARLDDGEIFDVAIVGGGASGVAIALDAATRGMRVALFERNDFGKGTSSRSTKLVHGGVRYLAQGNLHLVREALRERGRLRANAPHIVHELAFLVPTYSWWEGPYYGLGLRAYDLLAGRSGFGSSRRLSADEALAAIPNLERRGLRGGVRYLDGQFDDTRLLIAMVRTAAEHGAVLLNHCEVQGIARDAAGRSAGLQVRDVETGKESSVRARAVVNATGPFADSIRRLDDPHSKPLLAASQGIHLVLERGFLAGDTAIMVPRTSDGRVMFAIPWSGSTLLGTTDTPIASIDAEPRAHEEEIDFVLSTAGRYLSRAPSRDDVRAVFTGIRPLVAGHGEATSRLSRDHLVHISRTGLISVLGGKWTTARSLAEDVVDEVERVAGLPARPCVTANLRLRGWCEGIDHHDPLAAYGSDAEVLRTWIRDDPELARPLDDALPFVMAQVAYAVRFESARNLEDVLARRVRALFLDAHAATRTAPTVAKRIAQELGRDATWVAEQIASFQALASMYRVTTTPS